MANGLMVTLECITIHGRSEGCQTVVWAVYTGCLDCSFSFLVFRFSWRLGDRGFLWVDAGIAKALGDGRVRYGPKLDGIRLCLRGEEVLFDGDGLGGWLWICG